MDALKLRLRAKDQLHPILQELMTGYARFKGSKDWEGRSRLVGWSVFFARCPATFPRLIIFRLYLRRLITLNGMKASDEITEEQSRQVHPRLSSLVYSLPSGSDSHEQLLFDVDHAYAEFFRSLGGAKDDAS
jgi:ESCRT-I complex subunit VPS28